MGAEDSMKARMNDTQKELEEHKADQKSINAGIFKLKLYSSNCHSLIYYSSSVFT